MSALSEVGEQISEAASQRTEVGGRTSEIGGLKTEKSGPPSSGTSLSAAERSFCAARSPRGLSGARGGSSAWA